MGIVFINFDKHSIGYDMELEKVGFEIEEIEKCFVHITNQELKRLIVNYKAVIEQLLGSLAVPLLLMSHGLRSVKYFQYWLQGAVATKNVGKEKTIKGKVEIEKYIQRKFKEEKEINIEDAKKEIARLRAQMPLLDDAFQNNALNTLVNCWTIFEATVKGIWILCLNAYPKLFLFNVLNRNSQDIDGIFGKNISIGLLAKYNFNISNNIGDILVNKFDFTTTSGIKKSFKDLFALKDEELDFFNNDNISQLEITRHVIVHNAGIIDNDYLKRTNRVGEKLNDRVTLSTEQLSDYCNSSIYLTVELFKITDKIISKNDF